MQRRDMLRLGAAAAVAAPLAAFASPAGDEELDRMWAELMAAEKVAIRARDEAERRRMNFQANHPAATVQETTFDPAGSKWSFAATSSYHDLDKALFGYIEDHPGRKDEIWKFFTAKARELSDKTKARETAHDASVGEADRIADQLWSRVTDIEEAIAEAPCRTLAGLRVKVKLLQRWADFPPDNMEALAETMADALETIR